MAIMAPAKLGAKSAHQLDINKDLILVKFTRHYWDGRYQLKYGTVHVKGQAIDKARAAAARTNLVPEELHTALAAALRPLDQAMNLCDPFPIVGLRAVTPSLIGTFVPRWETGLAHLAAGLAEVAVLWDEKVVTWNREFWEPILGPAYHSVIGRLIKPAAHLPALYRVEYECWKPPEPSTAVLPSLEAQAWLAAGQAGAVQAFDSALATWACGPRDALVEALVALTEVLADTTTKVIKPATFNAARVAMEHYRLLEELGDDVLLKAINGLEDYFDQTIGRIEADSQKTSFTAELKAKADELIAAIAEVVEVAADETARSAVLARFHRGGRAIEFD